MKRNGKILRRTLSALLALVMLSAVLASCGKKKEENAEEEELEIYEDGLKGFTLNVLSAEEWYTDTPGNLFYTEEANGDTIKEAIYSRNNKVMDKYGLEITQTYIDKEANIADEVIKITAAQDDAYQAVTTDIGGCIAHLSENIYANALTIPYLKLDEEYWDGALMDLISINDFNAMLIGDILFEYFEGHYLTMYNTPLAADFGIENLYDVTSAGGWTYDRMMTEMEKVITDLDNDGQYGFDDRIGLLYASNSCMEYYTSAGLQFVKRNGEGELYYDKTVNEKAEMLAEKAHKLIHTKGYAVDWLIAMDGIATVTSMIENKNVLFQNMIISQVRRFYREIKTDFGLLPFPKLNEEQECYYTSSGTNGLAIPTSNLNLDKTGFALEALARYSIDFPNTYFHICLESKFTRDAESIDMIMLCYKNRYFDPMRSFDFGGFKTAITGIISGSGSFATAYANYADYIDASIEETMLIEIG